MANSARADSSPDQAAGLAPSPQPNSSTKLSNPRRRAANGDRAQTQGSRAAEEDSRVPASPNIPGDSSSTGGATEPRHTLTEVLAAAQAEGTAAPSNVLQELGKRFVEARKLNKGEAWRQLQADLMHNSHLLCPFTMPYKDLLTCCREIEDFIKGSSGQVGRSNEEIMAEFLRGSGELAELASTNMPASYELPPPVTVPLDTGDSVATQTSGVDRDASIT